MPEQDVGIHNGDPHAEEEQVDIAVGLTGLVEPYRVSTPAVGTPDSR